jgi:adenosine deaminase
MPLPSVLLHDHLDGGLRPNTVLELAEQHGYQDLPAGSDDELAAWFHQTDSGSLEHYLEAFTHTIGVMQHPEAIERVAYEAAVDLSADGVAYAEIRFCPSLNTRAGTSVESVIQAAASGLAMGEKETGLKWNLIVDALRHWEDSLDLARVAAASRDLGVVGFDLAGPEAGFPPADHLPALRLARTQGLRVTIHAGENAGGNGVAYMASAMDTCGAERLGHGVELVEDCIVEDGEIVKLGKVAQRIRDRRMPLEMCPASNLATSAMSAQDHPVGAMYRAGFNVTLSTDNRLMSATSMSDEFDFVTKHHGFDVTDLARITWHSLDAAFCSWETKAALWEDLIAPGFASAGADVERVWR